MTVLSLLGCANLHGIIKMLRNGASIHVDASVRAARLQQAQKLMTFLALLCCLLIVLDVVQGSLSISQLQERSERETGGVRDIGGLLFLNVMDISFFVGVCFVLHLFPGHQPKPRSFRQQSPASPPANPTATHSKSDASGGQTMSTLSDTVGAVHGSVGAVEP
eukprot:TRINITY_DN2120_c0_g1_i2.p2 TRINITY_DN2120_c0_g1~~TRINITY_DN2120_c0_g1_i2.p2  ORF type:complete len:163 (+),score=31.91 TRINITY_DN2120_c0_g1_i2:580-1068(+)